MDLMILAVMPKGGHPLVEPMPWNAQHPVSAEALDRFAEELASPEERRTVLAHLLSGCRDCRRALGRRWQGVPTEEADYEDAIERSAEHALEAFAARAC